ncbi:hypothetical protein AB0F72_33005 [Actinoplanes sp. NPDC023936]|uniref:helix-turn-helix transcriptional regulator n=1 Tax=Actinoplanes sp. NPDC023936 TaxID=3154910 RepID=UPI0033DD3ED9
MTKLVLVGPAEIRTWLRVSRQRAYQLISREDFPEPYQVLQMGKVWDIADVERWIRTHRPWLERPDRPNRLGARPGASGVPGSPAPSPAAAAAAAARRPGRPGRPGPADGAARKGRGRQGQAP